MRESDPLFTPVRLGALELANRIVMSPMTRDRAGPGDAPTDLMAEYYRQRAGAGLIVTEGVQPSPAGKGYWRTPGIHSQAQIDGWANTAWAVHAEGGRIVMQLMHVGRVSVRANKDAGADTYAPSAIASADPVPGPDGVPVPTEAPRALALSEIPAIVEEYAQAARNAQAAGMDGVELHCASGYLPHQFLNPRSNRREDAYGGPPENRARFALDVLAAMGQAIGADRVGLRISPGNPYNDMAEEDPAGTFAPLIAGADKLGLAYLHLVDMSGPAFDALGLVKGLWRGALIANNNLDAEKARALIAGGTAAACSFGRAFIANPDLPARIRLGAPLAKFDRAHLYTGEARGYTDYPALGEA